VLIPVHTESRDFFGPTLKVNRQFRVPQSPQMLENTRPAVSKIKNL
jgi:hypothetical protein